MKLAIIFSILFLNFLVANAEENMHSSSKPAMIVRFNQDEVYYDQALDRLLKKIINDDNYNYLCIESVSAMQISDHSQLNIETENIVSKIINSGIAENDIEVLDKADNGIASDEIRIIVK